MNPADAYIPVMAKEQRTDRTVTDEKNVARSFVFQNCLDLPHDPFLSINGALPTSNAHGRVGEKITGH